MDCAINPDKNIENYHLRRAHKPGYDHATEHSTPGEPAIRDFVVIKKK